MSIHYIQKNRINSQNQMLSQYCQGDSSQIHTTMILFQVKWAIKRCTNTLPCMIFSTILQWHSVKTSIELHYFWDFNPMYA